MPLDNVLDPSATPSETPLPETPAAPTPTFTDDTPVVLKEGEEPIPFRELKRGWMRTQDYTAKTSAAAREREEIAAIRAEVEARKAEFEEKLGTFQGVLQDPYKMQQLLLAAQQRLITPPQPPKAFTHEDLPQVTQSVLTAIEARFKEFETAQAQRQHATRLEQELTAVTGPLLERNPVLKAIPGFENAIYGEALKQPFKSVDEAKQFVTSLIEQAATAVKSAHEEQAKQAALDKARATHGIEPRGGSPILPTPKVYKDERERAEAISSFLDQITAG